MRKIKKVKIKQGSGKIIAKLFKVTPEFVSYCCNGKKNTPLAERIKMTAINMGGDAIYVENESKTYAKDKKETRKNLLELVETFENQCEEYEYYKNRLETIEYNKYWRVRDEMTDLKFLINERL